HPMDRSSRSNLLPLRRVGGGPYGSPMSLELTPVQRRTLVELVDVGGGAAFDPALESRLRERIERGIAEAAPPPLRLWKERLNDLARCEGLFAAALAGEMEPSRYGHWAARGTLVHRAIELEIGSSRPFDPHELARRAAVDLHEDRGFGPYWEG